MKKSSYKNELDEHESVRIQKTGEKKKARQKDGSNYCFFLPLVLIIYNICFLSTICFFTVSLFSAREP